MTKRFWFFRGIDEYTCGSNRYQKDCKAKYSGPWKIEVSCWIQISSKCFLSFYFIEKSLTLREKFDFCHFFLQNDKNFVKVRFLLKKLLNNWFDEFFFGESNSFLFNFKTVLHTAQCRKYENLFSLVFLAKSSWNTVWKNDKFTLTEKNFVKSII